MAFRQSIGFPSAPDYVLSVHAAPDSVTLESVNTTFTPTEAAEVLVRLELERDAETLQSYFSEHPELQEALGGVYLDHAAGGKLVLQLVQGHAISTDKIVQTLPPLVHLDRLQVNSVNWSGRHLQQQSETISAAMSMHTELEAVFVEEVTNQVVAIVNPDAVVSASALVAKSALSADLAALVADPAVTIRAEEINLVDTAVSGGNNWNITGSGSRCTLGFEVTYSGGSGMVTAGHCMKDLSSGTKVYGGSTEIGTVTSLWANGSTISTSPDAIDAGVLKMINASTATDNILPTSDINGSTSNYTVGTTRCLYGTVSGKVCGTIIVSSVTVQNINTGLWYKDMFYNIGLLTNR